MNGTEESIPRLSRHAIPIFELSFFALDSAKRMICAVMLVAQYTTCVDSDRRICIGGWIKRFRCITRNHQNAFSKQTSPILSMDYQLRCVSAPSRGKN